MTYTIEVAQEDIEEGWRNSCSDCPVALAIKRETGSDYDVHRRSVEDSRGRRYPLPEVARKFIDEFDDCAKVSPFTFTIDLPEDDDE